MSSSWAARQSTAKHGAAQHSTAKHGKAQQAFDSAIVPRSIPPRSPSNETPGTLKRRAIHPGCGMATASTINPPFAGAKLTPDSRHLHLLYCHTLRDLDATA
mmetsp:Transcript_19580/g.45532  ORF Transcript_19580/g.45532 Transcript_19580/m.45532 type:complete len:102 (-) Transcript_19580:97-402(-)